MQNKFYNQPAVDWAQRNLAQPVQIKQILSSRRGRIFIYLLAFSVPLVFISLGIVLKFIGGGDPMNSTRALACGFVLLIPSGIIVVLGLFMQTKFAKSLDARGVNAGTGRRFLWENLYYVDHVSKITRTGGVTRKIEDNQLELIFENGKVIIPPLIQDREKIWNLIDTMPVQVRDDGAIRANQAAATDEGKIRNEEDLLKYLKSLRPENPKG
jgi:hypothetical protein